MAVPSLARKGSIEDGAIQCAGFYWVNIGRQ